MSDDWANSSLLSQRLREDRLYRHVGIAFRCVWMVFGLGAMTVVILQVSDWWKRPPLRPFLPCDPQIVPSQMQALELMGQHYRCSTVNQRLPQPCLCCNQTACWTNVHIVSNSSRTATVQDRASVNGATIMMRREHVPVSIFVCLDVATNLPEIDGPVTKHALDSPIDNHFVFEKTLLRFEKSCFQLKHAAVAHLLRAQEQRFGWTPAGDAI